MAFKLADLYVAIGGDREPLNKTLDDTERDVKKRGGGLGRQLGSIIGGGLALGFGAAIAGVTALAASALDFSGDLNQQTDLIARSLGKTTEEAEQFEGVIKRVFSGRYGESVEQSGEAVRLVLESLGDTADTLSEDQLVKLTEAALGLSQVFEVDVAESMRAADLLVKQGIASSSEEALAIITAGFQNGLNVSGDFLDTLNEYGDDFARLGLDGSQALGLINRGLEAGILNTDKIGDAVNEFGINLKDPAVLASLREMDGQIGNIAQNFQSGYITEGAAFEGILARLSDIDDATLQNTIGVELFRGVWEDFGAQGILALGQMDEGLIDHSDALSQLAPEYTSLGDLGSGLWRRTLVALSPFSEKVLQLVNERLPLIESGFEWLETEGIEMLNNAADAAATFIDAFVASESDTLLGRIEDGIRAIDEDAATTFGNVAQGIITMNTLLFLGTFSIDGMAERMTAAYNDHIAPFIANSLAGLQDFIAHIQTALDIFTALTGIEMPDSQYVLAEMSQGAGIVGEWVMGGQPQGMSGLANVGAMAGQPAPAPAGLGANRNTNNNSVKIDNITVQTNATNAREIAESLVNNLRREMAAQGMAQ